MSPNAQEFIVVIAGVVHRSVLRNGERRNIIDRALSGKCKHSEVT